MSTRALARLAFCALFATSGVAMAQPMAINAVGGGLGQTLTVTLNGPASAQYLLLFSLTTGPTVLPPPHISPLNVGLELVNFAVSIPGFLGALPPSGTLALPLPIPADPLLDNLNVNFQNLRLSNNIIVEKSNLWRVTFDTPGQYAFTLNSLAAPRAFATAELLNDGSVLVAGGGNGTITSSTGLNSAERYSPSLESFTTVGAMTTARALHRSTKLLDGRVLLTGGVDQLGVPVATAEIFDPSTNTFSATGNMSIARVGHSATILPDGKVLVVGGSSLLVDATTFISSASATSEIFNPTTNSFSPGPSISSPRTFHDAARLNDGRVFVSGGLTFSVIFGVALPDFSNAAQIYSQSTNAFAGNLAMGTKRAAHTSIVLADGRVLLVGGGSGTILAPTILGACQLFNPSNNSFATTGSLTTARAIAGLVRLPDGRILCAGGAQGDILNPTPVQTNEIWSLAGSWTSGGSMLLSRSGQGTVLLNDQSVGIFAGGGGPTNVSLNSAEIYQP